MVYYGPLTRSIIPGEIFTGNFIFPSRSAYCIHSNANSVLRAAATEQTFVLNPCVLNTQNIADIGLGEGLVFNLTETLRQLLDSMGFANNLADCIAAPHDEPQFTWPPSSKPKLVNQLP